MTDTHAAPLTLFNSLTRQLEPFQPGVAGTARVYSCGPTVYARQHLGNMRAYLFTDTLTRVLRWKGYDVTHVINITDVGHLTSDADTGDDKMEKAAAREQLTAWDIAERYTTLFKADLAKLNVVPPSKWSVATDHIDDMIEFAGKIGASTYELDSGLYFDTATVPDYGRLAGHRPDDKEVARIEAVAGKRNPADFAIWRKSEDPGKRQMEWPSPWGVGAPGWHLECSVMSMKYLGAHFDIHTGGIDHREIHHPNEIAQNQAYTGSADSGASIWMHNNFLVQRGAKMSKSSGGFAILDDLVDAGVHPLAYRMLCLQAHYRSELEFSAENVLAALTRLKRIAASLEKLRAKGGKAGGDALIAKFDEALSSDLNLPVALTLLDEALAAGFLDAALAMDAALGLELATLDRAALRVRPVDASLSEAEIDAALADRRTARAAKDFAASDAIRDRLNAAGIEVMDGDPLGWDWRPTLV